MMLAFGLMLCIVLPAKMGDLQILEKLRMPTLPQMPTFPCMLSWKSDPSKVCTEKPAGHIRILNETETPSQPKEDKPTIVLKAPCMLPSFNTIAQKYHGTGWWHFQKSEGATLEVIHSKEPAVTLREGVHDNASILEFLEENALPCFGRFTDITYEWYLTHSKGIVWALMDSDEATDAVRPAMMSLAHRFGGNYNMGYVETAKNEQSFKLHCRQFAGWRLHLWGEGGRGRGRGRGAGAGGDGTGHA